jgi:hypothetical protein
MNQQHLEGHGMLYLCKHLERGRVKGPKRPAGVPLPHKRRDAMDHKQIVTARLAALGIPLSDKELDQLAAAYASLLKWEAVVQGMVQAETEPALIFQAKVEGSS